MKILFMCVANSARSQLAEGLGRSIFPEAEIFSAGSHPGTLNPLAVQVMKEIGIDISNHYSKSIDQIPQKEIQELDYLITLCAEEVCPVMPSSAKKLHWPFTDPATKVPLPEAEALLRFRVARDSIREKLLEFKKEILTQ
jgi:arsenate reductase (thioredoxin)